MIPVDKIWLFETDILDPYFIGEKDGITVTLENDDLIDFINIKTVTYFMNTIVKGAFKETFKYGGEDAGIAESTGKSEKAYELQFNMPIENRDNLNRFAGSQYSLLGERVDGSKFIVFGQFEADDLEVDNRVQNRMTLKTDDTSARLFEVNSLNIENIEYIIDDVITPTPPPIPSIPTGFNIVVVGENQIDVSWTAQSNVDNFVIEWGVDGFTFPNTASVDGSQTTYSITGLDASTLYYVRMKAVNESGESGYTSILSATTDAAPAEPFTFTVQSDNSGVSNTDQFTFPQRAGTSPNYVISVVEEPSNTITVTADTDPTTLTFAGGAGLYTIKIDGVDIQPHFDNGGDKDKIIQPSYFGECIIGSDSFNGCSNLIINTSDKPKNFNETTTLAAFNLCVSIVGNNSFDGWDLSGVVSVNAMLRNTNLFDWDLSSWVVPDVENASEFLRSADIFNSPIPNFGKLDDLGGFLRDCPLFNQEVDFLDVSNVVGFDRVFNGASSFNKSVSSWDTSSGEDFSNMFLNASAFNQSLGSFNLSSATTLVNMLNNCGMSTANYNLTLDGWVNGGWTIPIGLTFGASGLVADSSSGGVDGTAARTTLINTYGWTIIDATP